jgi:NAD(P)-dependent dehydrogenase (short-subunit alcohol dehydrogenase family)
MDLTTLHVVVTGGTGALGTAVVSALLAAGATCHVPAFEAEVSAQWPHAGHERVHTTTGQDLTDEATVTAFYEALPGLWASVHCAGGFGMSAIAETPLSGLTAQLDRNLVSCFLCCREAVRAMRRTGDQGGRIVNVAARPALEPRTGAGMIPYTISKAGVAALTCALGQEVADERIWVNAVAPSIIDTPANRAAMPKAKHSRWPTTDGLAATIVWLASPENQTSRGAIVPVYGRS